MSRHGGFFSASTQAQLLANTAGSNETIEGWYIPSACAASAARFPAPSKPFFAPDPPGSAPEGEDQLVVTLFEVHLPQLSPNAGTPSSQHVVRFETAGKDHPEVGYSHFHLACLAAAQGRRQEALDHLRQAVALGWREREIVDAPELDPLRGDPELEAIVAEVEEKMGDGP